MAEAPGWLFLADAMIRSVLHLDPEILTDAQWCLQVKMAEAMQNMYVQKIGRLLGG